MNEVGKVAAISQAMMATYKGAVEAASAVAGIPFVGPALAVAAAASFVAAGLANVAQIEGVSFAAGGLVQGGVPGIDSVPSMLMPGELVVPEKNFDDVVSAYAGSTGGQAASSQAQGGSATVNLQLSGDFGKMVEASIVQRQRLKTSILRSP